MTKIYLSRSWIAVKTEGRNSWIPGIVHDFLARDMELTGHALLKTQNSKRRLSDEMIMKDRYPV